MKIKGFQNQLREPRKITKKTDMKKGKKPPSIKMNYRGIASNYITTLNDTWRSKSLKKYLNPNKVIKNKSSSLIKRFAIELGKSKRKSEYKKSKKIFKSDFPGKIDTNYLVKSILNDNPTISPKSLQGMNKGSIHRSVKKRRNSNVSTTF